MLASRRAIAQAMNLMKARRLCLAAAPRAPALAVHRRCMCSKSNHDGEKDTGGQEGEQKTKSAEDAVVSSPHLRDKFLLFEDRDSEVILDIHEELEQMRDGRVPRHRGTTTAVEEHSLERGETGVYDIQQLVPVLEAENARDICVLRMPPEMIYADYLVIANARSTRHLEAMMEFIRKLYKKKKRSSDKMANVQGATCKTWQVMDMGNIVLHLMMPEDRERFDIETLWAVGEKYDDNTVRPMDTEANLLQSHLDFLESWRPLQEEEETAQ